MNSSTPRTTVPSRPYSMRIARWIFRLVWNRRTGWTLVCIVSLLTLYYQWENRRSARELKAAHLRLVERIGTDSPLEFASPKIPDEQNYFAIPQVEAWAAGELSHGSRFKRYILPKTAFFPPGFIRPEVVEDDEAGVTHLDFAAWEKLRDVHGEPPAVVMNRELGDANGLLSQLAVGLNRPFSCFKPGKREALEQAGENPYEADLPNIGSVNEHMGALCIHLRCAAAAGDVEKTRSVSLILLRLFPEAAASHGTLISSLVSLATHGLVFEALQDALARPVWDEAGLHALQMQLGKINDLEVVEQAMSMETLLGFAGGIYIREAARRGDRKLLEWNWGNPGEDWSSRLSHFATGCAIYLGPSGWHDANISFFVDRLLDVLGPKGETTWLQAEQRDAEVKKLLEREYKPLNWNPRRFIGAMALPNIGSTFSTAAQTLFRRRCLIIACALEKHRMQYGIFPDSLQAVAGDLRLFSVRDPARPENLPGYRLEKGGYLLWSAGPDAQDDGGTPKKDWLWRMKLIP